MAKLKTLAKTEVMKLRTLFRRFDSRVKRAIIWPFRKLWRFKKLRPHLLPLAKLAHQHHRITAGGLAGLMVLGVMIPALQDYARAERYLLSGETAALVGRANQNITDKIKYNPQTAKFEFNADKKAPLAEDGTPLTGLAAQTGGGGEDSEQQYSVDVSRSLRDGVTYHENNLGVNFTLKPQFAALNGEKVEGGRLLYPLANGLGGQLIYTATSKGLKEDVVLHKKPSTDEVTLRYAIDLPDSLEAKLLDSGDLGVYSADPSLYGNIQYGDESGREAIEKARQVAKKDHLAFVIPAPYVVGLNEHGEPERAGLSSRFLLSDDKTTLSVVTTGFAQTDETMYPLSIDPSVTVTSTSDFTDGGNDEDNSLTFGTDQISRREISGGAIGTWSTTTSLPTTASYSRPVAYGGRLYVVINNSGSTILRYTTINSNGTLGASWSLPANQPTTATSDDGYELVLYGGRLYFIGGGAGNNLVEYSTIQANGDVSAWRETSVLQQPRQYFGAAAYNGYIYAAGTIDATTVVEYAAVKADGSLSAWQATTSLPTERAFGSMVTHGGCVYVVGGYYFDGGSAIKAPTMYASIGDNGSLGGWTTADAITIGPYGELAGVTQAGGYIYIVGGYGMTSGDSSSGQVTYGQITADGNVKPWRPTTAVGTSGTLISPGAVAYGGYLYAMGGSTSNAMRYAPIKTAGDVDNWTSSSGAGVRNNAASVVYGGYLYLLGGQSGTTGTALATNMRIPLNADGSLGTAITSTSAATGSFTAVSPYVAVTRSVGAFAYDGYMYAIGGTNAAGTEYRTTVQRSPINASTGALGTWSTTGMTQLGAGTGRWGHGVAFYNNFIYVAGGRFNGTSVSSAVLHTSLSTSGVMGASWTGTSGFTTARTQHQLVQYGGYMYLLGGWNGTTVYSDVQYAKINPNGTLAAWATTESLFGGTGVHSFGAFAANGYIYVLGGARSSGVSTTTTKSQINTDGSLNVWQQVGDSGGASVDRSYHTAAYSNGYAYVYGGIPSSGGSGSNTSMRGRINNGGTGVISAQATAGSASPAHFSCTFTYQDTLYKAGGGNSMSSLTFNEDGSTGTWTHRGNLPESRSGAGCALDGNRMYLVGGYTTGGTLLSSVIYATINDDSSFSAWQTATSLPDALQHGNSFARNGYLYIIGGATGAAQAINTVRYAPISSDGSLGSWSTTSTLYQAVASAAATVVGPYVYLVGGLDTTGDEQRTAQYALINGDGTLGTWASTSRLTTARSYASATASNGYLYVVGGNDNAAAATTTVYYTPINADGSLDGWQTTAALPEASFGHQSLFHQGRLYTIGGSTPFYQKVFYSTGIDMQARQATYTKTIHAGYFGAVTGVNFSGTFSAPDAVDVDYRITSGVGGEFGRTYNATDVVDENINPTELCTTLEGSARAGEYIFITVTIDDSSAAMYSEAEAANTSVVGGITLDYIPPLRSPTEMRMRGGKWFKDDSLQTLDTCIPLSAATHIRSRASV